MRFYDTEVAGWDIFSVADVKAMIGDGYAYLATPYSKYPGGIHYAHGEACRIAGRLIEAGLCVFSPIAHGHSIARQSGIDPLNHKLWMAADHPLMVPARILIVAKMEGWDESDGVSEECNIFLTACKPVVYLEDA